MRHRRMMPVFIFVNEGQELLLSATSEWLSQYYVWVVLLDLLEDVWLFCVNQRTQNCILSSDCWECVILQVSIWTSGFQLSGAQYVEVTFFQMSAWTQSWNSLITSYPFYQILSLFRKHLPLKAQLDTLQQGAHWSWGFGCSPLADADGNRLDRVVFRNQLILAVQQVTVCMSWWTACTWILWRGSLVLEVVACHRRLLFPRAWGDPERQGFPTTRDQCQIPKGLVEWHALPGVWNHCLAGLYGALQSTEGAW